MKAIGWAFVLLWVPAFVKASETFVITARNIVIPYHCPQKNITDLQLYVSTDRGANWQCVAKRSVTSDHGRFRYQSGAAGEYWFSLRSQFFDKTYFPASTNIFTPCMIVIVVDDPLASEKRQTAAEIQSQNELIVMHEPSFVFPVSCRSDVEEVQLYVSEDRGSSWHLARSVLRQPEWAILDSESRICVALQSASEARHDSSIHYYAAKPGEYWFATRARLANDRFDPVYHNHLVPVQKVVVFDKSSRTDVAKP